MIWSKGNETDLIVHLIRLNWHRRFLTFPHPGNETMIGVLRTLLNSIEDVHDAGAELGGYLSYGGGVLAQNGHSGARC